MSTLLPPVRRTISRRSSAGGTCTAATVTGERIAAGADCGGGTVAKVKYCVLALLPQFASISAAKAMSGRRNVIVRTCLAARLRDGGRDSSPSRAPSALLR
jgi:hypothetical protein